jgi:hypothetical protein
MSSTRRRARGSAIGASGTIGRAHARRSIAFNFHSVLLSINFTSEQIGVSIDNLNYHKQLEMAKRNSNKADMARLVFPSRDPPFNIAAAYLFIVNEFAFLTNSEKKKAS